MSYQNTSPWSLFDQGALCAIMAAKLVMLFAFLGGAEAGSEGALLVGEVVEAEYDAEKNAYLLDGVVKLPAKYEDYASGEHFFVILDDEENESGSHSIRIGIFEEKD